MLSCTVITNIYYNNKQTNSKDLLYYLDYITAHSDNTNTQVEVTN